MKNKFAYAVINVEVVEAYATGDTALSIKVAKNSLAYTGMFIGSGTKGAEVTAIDKTNKVYDVLTIKAAFGEDIARDAVLFEAVAVDGLKQKYVANSACTTGQRWRMESLWFHCFVQPQRLSLQNWLCRSLRMIKPT